MDELLHERHFTVAEANTVIPSLRDMLERLRDAKERLTDSQAREALSGAAPSNGGGDAGTQVGEAFLEVRALIEEISTMGIVLRDIDRGLVDFPSFVDGREAYLCWRLADDDEVEFWHELDAGFSGRQPLP